MRPVGERCMALDGSSEAAEVELSRAVSSLPGWYRLSPCELGGLAPTPLPSDPAGQAELSGGGCTWSRSSAAIWLQASVEVCPCSESVLSALDDAFLSCWAGSPRAAVPNRASMSRRRCHLLQPGACCALLCSSGSTRLAVTWAGRAWIAVLRPSGSCKDRQALQRSLT